MLNHLIEEDEPSKLELATEHHWDELNGRGITTFSDDEETRVIDMDIITQDCLNDFRLLGLYETTNEGLPFIEALRDKIRTMKNDLMETALEDFYS